MGKNIFLKILHAGITENCDVEERKKIIITTSFMLVSIVILIVFGIDNFIDHNIELALVICIFTAIFFLNYVYLIITGDYRKSALVIVLVMLALSLYLLITGGNRNTGPLWCYLLPIIVYYILGLRIGTIVLLIFLPLVYFILFVPSHELLKAGYDPVFSTRYFGSLITVAITAFIYEYTRQEGRRELIALNLRLDRLSQTDDLTNLANRRAMLRQISHEIGRHERHQRPFCILVGDIDFFKEVNDQFGHECGDQVLINVAHTLENNTKKQDIAARWGGEEFLILLPETDLSQGKLSAERLRAAIEQLETKYNGHIIKVTMSFGISEFKDGQSYNSIIQEADDLLYKAKQSGRNRVF